MFKNKPALVITGFCLVNLILHLIADANTGFQSDELLHIETGNHPGWGYMEFPPMIGWLAFIQDQFHSSSVFVHHIFTHLASLLIIILVGLTTLELGGKTRAVFVALLCLAIAPGFDRGGQLFQPVVFSQLFWVLSFYQWVRLTKTADRKYLLYLTLSIGLGFLSKYDILFFVAGLTGSLFFKRTRDIFITKSIWKYKLLFLVLAGPNLWWEYKHQFPVFNMFSRLYETQLGHLTIAGVLKELILALNPLAAVIWIGGLVFMFNKTDKTLYRPLAASIVISVLALAVSKSKAYYFFPVVLTLFPFGAIWFEQKVLARRRAWILYPAAALMILSGVALMPYGMGVLPPAVFLKYAKVKKEDGHYRFGLDCQEYFSRQKWDNTLTALREVYDSLPSAQQHSCLIWGKHYSQAGAVNLMGPAYGLPAAFSYHGSFYLWAPPSGEMPATVIAFTNDEAGIDFFQGFFGSVTPVKKVFNPYAMFDKDLWQTIYICKDPKQDFAGLKADFKTRVFE
jgi:hypothetical protein